MCVRASELRIDHAAARHDLNFTYTMTWEQGIREVVAEH